MSPVLITTIIAVISFAMIALDKFPKYIVATVGALAIIIFGKLSVNDAINYIDFDVISLLVAMILIVDICAKSGMFSLIATKILKKTKGNPTLIFFSLAFIAAFASTVLANIATIILLMQITFSISKKLNISPFPFLMVEVFSANIGGTATMIGDPPNLIIANEGNFHFIDFINNLAPITFLIFLVSSLILYLLFRRELKSDASKDEIIFDEKNIVTNKFKFYLSCFTLSMVILGFFFGNNIGLTPSKIAIIGAVFLMLFEKPTFVLKSFDWQSILLFAGLFIIVGGLEHCGLLKEISDYVKILATKSLAITSISLLWMSGLISGFIDNVPYTLALSPVVNNLNLANNAMWWSLALGACLGGNLTTIAATGNIMVVQIAHTHKCNISFMRFMKYGVLITTLSLILSSIYILIRYI